MLVSNILWNIHIVFHAEEDLDLFSPILHEKFRQLMCVLNNIYVDRVQNLDVNAYYYVTGYTSKRITNFNKLLHNIHWTANSIEKEKRYS